MSLRNEKEVRVPKHLIKKYKRRNAIDSYGVKTKSEKAKYERQEKKIENIVKLSARTELLQNEESGFIEANDEEETYLLSQREIAKEVDITSASKLFDLTLDQFGPYTIDYFRNGRFLLLGGYKGHVAAMDWLTKQLLCEINVMESVHDICWLHMPTMYAVAQKDWLYIYDTQGIELHCLKRVNRVLKMEFLPYHFLLATASDKGFLTWLDISVGKIVADFNARLGKMNVMCQNLSNAIITTGHPSGNVNMWSPNEKEPVVKMLCHQHPITAMAIDNTGKYMATSGMNGIMKIWDLRTYGCLQSYQFRYPTSQMQFSQKGLLAVGKGNVVEVYKDCCTSSVSMPYLRHKLSTQLSSLKFCPFEDVMGVGHRTGFSSLLIPGAGEPNFDAHESNPYMTKSQRREMEVKALLEKIQPEFITLDPHKLGQINVKSLKDKMEEKKKVLFVKPQKIEYEAKKKSKCKSGPKNSALSKQEKRRKQLVKHKELVKKVRKEILPEKEKKPKVKKNVLDRFKKKENA